MFVTPAGRAPAASDDSGRPPRRKLFRVLGVREGAAIGIGVAIGAGIFRTPGYVAGFLGSPWAILGVWALGWLIVMGDALILSELASRIPRAGGWYVYIEKGWGRFPAFVYGWVYMLIIDPASSAALVVVLGEYLGSLLGLPPQAGRLLAIGVTLGLFGLSLAGIRLGSRVQDVLTYTKLGLLAAVGILALFVPALPALSHVAGPRTTGFLAIGLALQGVLWTFEGYANTTTMTEESVDPRRTLPRSLMASALLLGATYLLVNAAYLHVLGRDRLAASVLPAADMAARVFGGAGLAIFLVLAILTALGSLNGAVLSSPRVAYAVSRSGSAPEALTRVSRVGTPDLATLWFAAAWTIYAWFGSFEGLIAVSVFIGALANVAVTASLLRLRGFSPQRRTAADAEGSPAADAKNGPDGGAAGRRPGSEAGIFLSPAYPALPIVMLIVWSAFALDVLYDQKWKVGYGLAVMALAAPVYLWIRRRQIRPAAAGGTG